MAAVKKRWWWVRSAIQVFFFVLVALTALNETLNNYGINIPFIQKASLHALCPFGGVVSFYQFISNGTLVKKVHESSMVLFGITLVLLVLVGPVICGWICPLGSIQEWIGKIGKKIFKKRYNTFVPSKLDKVLRYLRYVVLIWVTYMTIVSGKLIFQDYDPYFTLFNFWTSEVSLAGIIILTLTLVLSLFVERPFCKYACPFGAFQGLYNLIRIFPIKRNVATCINCKACDRACPMNIEVSKAQSVRDHQCISCLECTSEVACPVTNTVLLAQGKFSDTRAKGDVS
ncbi:MAG TPA: 4Fe-4S binding protein [Spirochaetia bacterium]|nr:4Fe-4S binding protein [Spirochaetales bacterium]HRS65877.1 4Fe-4S binding protein [Spirochaetia bacterium]HOT59474.1 4Fe-4S binding protein [Spirochaetales bacterium]HPD80707.1 4Fe-4S binding protein [Spirochaetales bacterium]HQG40628.1 4Fe-4S binding protein [Spirochaetales bacterium]